MSTELVFLRLLYFSHRHKTVQYGYSIFNAKSSKEEKYQKVTYKCISRMAMQ